MPLEDLTGTKYIDSLVSTNPDGSTDYGASLDDHIRGVKNVLKKTFPNVNGAVNGTPAELNLLVGKTALIETSSIPSGTKMIFVQNAAPTGWTFVAENNDTMFINSSTVTDGGVAVSGSSWTIDGLTSGNAGYHTHTYSGTTGIALGAQGRGGNLPLVTVDHTHTYSGTTSDVSVLHAHTISSNAGWRPLSVYVISCTKN